MDLASWQLHPGELPSPHMAYGRQGHLGLVVLDRPRAINSLTVDMVRSMRAQLTAWAQDERIRAVALTGAGERGLCAGGDVVAVRAGVLAGGDAAVEAVDFFAVEYEVNRLIAHFPKPFVSLIEGVTMGGGVGLACQGNVRLVDPESRIAMPETIIGFFPDVGARHLLARCPGQLGAHLAMTGCTVRGADAVRLGLADAVVAAADFPAVLAAYAAGEEPSPAELGDVAPASALVDGRGWVDECYAGDDPVAVLERLAGHDDEAARAAAGTIVERSPFAVALALASVRQAEGMSGIDEVLESDLAIARAIVHEPDFHEGVRAQLVDKDRRPRWQDTHVSDVDPAHVQQVLHGERPRDE
ncbi:enoyl-CoA hydratase [Austwickia chelonae]|uniref:3-hydroxyisobutyryl-CoA hydrolase n=1 Tax=Austwickia chelonae NBRC 105200 TaxID=1184607 RepID=K6UN41_9MICO|nr:enoyl-CoA hydratase/isomerase family protein [Austwickia chelonae]GAB78666.1 putative enoyl-CoA hydratase [Austwickia chelonae NBRC 105200]SEW34533.1 enoyl-CoA hydratase [Austwickia chelonae]